MRVMRILLKGTKLIFKPSTQKSVVFEPAKKQGILRGIGY